MLIRLNRFGRFQVCASSANQCKNTDWQLYKYHIRITCPENNKDKDGFIIDNMLVQSLVDGLFRQAVSSCENMVCDLSKALKELCEKNKVHFTEIYVRIDPEGIDSGNYAYFEHTTGSF